MSDWTTLISPFIEVFISNLVERHESNKLKQTIFIEDSERIWDNFDELTKILEPLDISLIKDKVVKKMFQDLKKKIYDFWKRYDYDNNNKISDEEWKKAKEEFPQDLLKDWKNRKKELEEIKETAEELRKIIIAYLGEKDLKEEQNQHAVIDLDNYFEQQEQTPVSSRTNLLSKSQKENIELQELEQEALQVQPAYGQPGSSKPK